MVESPMRRHRTLVFLLAATAVCYLIGYPLALLGHSNIGWVFVGLGGPLLAASGISVIRQVHRNSSTSPRRNEPPS